MFDSQSLSGIWRIKLISIEDAPGNLEYVTASDMDALGLSRKFGVSKLGEQSDLDGDGITDSLDAFPLDATETIDTDGDGV